MAQIIKSELWAKYVEVITRGGDVGGSSGKVFQSLDEGDVNDLQKLLRTESGPQRNAALQVLFVLMCVWHDGRFQPGRAQSICPALRGIVAESYPLDEPGQQAMTLWQSIEPENAATFVNEWVDRNGITEAVANRVTLDLSLGNQESFRRLRHFAESNPDGALAQNAHFVLERTAPDWKEKLKGYGRQWREKRDCRTLRHLTNQMVDRMPREDVLISEILEVMGEPDSVVSGCYTYLTKEEFQGWLFLETDKNGKVLGWKLENC